MPLKLDYDRRAMRRDFTKFLNKRFNTESDDSDYEQENMMAMMQKDTKRSNRSGQKSTRKESTLTERGLKQKKDE